MPIILIPFLIKGAAILVKAAVASKKVSIIGKTIVAGTHTVAAPTVIATTVATCTVVGGIAWSLDRLEDLEACYLAWEEKDWEKFSGRAASLLGKVHSVGTDSLVHSAETVLTDKGFDEMHVAKFSKDLFDLLNEVLRDGRTR